MSTEEMPQMRPTTRTTMLAASVPVANPEDRLAQDGLDHPHRHFVPQATVPVIFAVLLLVLATTSQGAFAISSWAPLALFVLALLLGTALVPGVPMLPRSTPIRVALAAIWALAAWSLLSMLWAKSSGDAFEAGDRMILYAAIATLPFALPVSRRSLAAVGWSVVAGIGAIAVYVLIRLLAGGQPLFLAGRLNDPIGYRNATALLFALPVWPFIVAAAAGTNRRAVRATALSLATLCLGLAFLTQSRGILIGLALGGCLTLAVGPDRVRRAWVAILVAGGVALASPWLLRPYHAFERGQYVSAHLIMVAALALLVLAIAAFFGGMALALFDQGLRPDSPEMAHLRRAARFALAGAVVVAVIGAAAAIGNPVTFARQRWHQFHDLNASTTTGSTRYLSVGGQRYDLWRVALKEFAGSPVLGVGADNYSFDYYRDRGTNRNLDDPHSLAFSLLSEQGAVGVGLFCLFAGGLMVALGRGWRTLGPSERRHAIAPAAAGAVLLGQSMVDWIWLIPGLTAIGLLLLSLSAAQVTSGPEWRDRQSLGPGDKRRGARGRRLAVVAAIGTLLTASAGVLALFVSNAYVERARTVVSDPSAELAAARTASELDPWSVTPHYLEASALETMGNRAAAYRQLRDALSLEPQNFATLGVLGDFEARGRDFAAARGYYRRALALDPLDIGLQKLAQIGEGQRP